MRTRAVWGFLAAGALFAAACSESSVLEDVGAFPCAKDGTCPLLYACDADAGVCMKDTASAPGAGKKHPDDVCVESRNECDLTTGLCVLGVCAPMSGGADCPKSHPVAFVTGCLLDCSSTLCPTGLVCADVFAGDPAAQRPARACIGKEAALSDTHCAANCASAAYKCVAGTCVLACNITAAPCPTGRTCATPDTDAGSSSAGCFSECAGDAGSCPLGMKCTPAHTVTSALAMACVSGG